MGSGDSEGLSTQLKTRKLITKRYLAPIIQRALEAGDLDNAHWLPGMGNPADGLTDVRSDMAPSSGLLESGRFDPGFRDLSKGRHGRSSGPSTALEFILRAHIQDIGLGTP